MCITIGKEKKNHSNCHFKHVEALKFHQLVFVWYQLNHITKSSFHYFKNKFKPINRAFNKYIKFYSVLREVIHFVNFQNINCK